MFGVAALCLQLLQLLATNCLQVTTASILYDEVGVIYSIYKDAYILMACFYL